MIKFDKDEFLKPQIYSTNDEYETRCNVTKEIVDDVKKIQQENKKYKEVIDRAIEYIEKTKERRILRLLEMEVLDILKEVE